MNKILTSLLIGIFLISLTSAFDFPSDSTEVSFFTGNLTNLSEMADTNIPAPGNNEVLTWSSATGMWIARAVEGFTDTFALNYTEFLTHVSWAEVVNGTMFTSEEANNGTYITSDSDIWDIAETEL